MRDAIVDATDRALRTPVHPRFLTTERGFQGQFYCHLQQNLKEFGLIQGHQILEQEYPKKGKHNADMQRPDVILHIPSEFSGRPVDQDNFAVWALKIRADAQRARDDFEKLNSMFAGLNYPLGIFVNIGAEEHFANEYKGPFFDRLLTVAVCPDGDQLVTRWGPSDEDKGAAE